MTGDAPRERAISGPLLETRTAAELLDLLRARQPAYVPGWAVEDDGPATEVARAYARFLAALAERLNNAPTKNKLAFLDQLGIDQMPAQASRAPVVFTPIPGTTGARAPAGTRLSARNPTGGDPLPFETENEIVVADTALVEVRTVLPGEDLVADHSVDVRGEHRTVLFSGGERIAHQFHLGHGTVLALAGEARVELHIQLLQASDEELAVRWTFWDGDAWRPFQEFQGDETKLGRSFDATTGLTRSGVIRLAADCAKSKPRRVDGRESSWIRAELVDPFPPKARRTVPQIDLLGLNTIMERRLTFTPDADTARRPRGGTCDGGILPDGAFGAGQQIDLSKLAYPFGQQPSIDAAFYVSSDEIFSKPGAEATVCVVREVTPNDAMSTATQRYQAQVKNAQDLVTALENSITALRTDLEAMVNPGGVLSWSGAVTVQAAALPRLADVVSGVAACQPEAQQLAARLRAHVGDVRFAQTGDLEQSVLALVAGGAEAVANIAAAANALINGRQPIPLGLLGDDLEVPLAKLTALAAAVKVKTFPTLGDLQTYLDGSEVAALLDTLDIVAAQLAEWRKRPPEPPIDLSQLDAARDAVEKALAALAHVATDLANVGAVTAATAAGVTPPTTPPAELAWEYWDGRAWKAVPSLVSTPGPRTKDLYSSGEVTFTVPSGWQPTEVGGTTARWLRLRIQKGSYSVLRTVSWLDSETGDVNFLPVMEARPPALGDLKLAYLYRSPRVRADHALAYNDFQWTDGTEPLKWRGSGFAPFTVTTDVDPTLYLRFDRPLAAGLVSMYAAIEEKDGVVAGPQLDWERWDGSRWSPLTVRDETKGLIRPGIIGALWPDLRRPLTERVATAEDTSAELFNSTSAARFRVGDRVFLRQGEDGEAAMVAAIEGPALRFPAPLARSFRGATVERMSLARFGLPGDWIRARVAAGAAPPLAALARLLLNAVWASQLGTVTDEAVGSTDGRPSQTFFASRPNMLEETLELRELDGARADLDIGRLRRELEAEGRAEGLRVVQDPLTGKVTEAWVAWRHRSTLYFSGGQDRDYVAQRSQGRLMLGDGRHGLVPIPGRDNVRLRSYRFGGGAAGDVGSGAVNAILSGALAQAVTNPEPASGGADAEDSGSVERRGPLLLRHRRQAITPADYEQVACEASPAVARARTLSGADLARFGGPGAVSLAVLPRSAARMPVPSAELRRRVRDFVIRRSPASLRAEVVVLAPVFELVGVVMAVAPRRPEEGGELRRQVLDRLNAFLHPVTGGPGKQGWAFGQDLFSSDLASALIDIPELDYIDALQVVARGSATGTAVPVAHDRIVAAGHLQVALVGAEV